MMNSNLSNVVVADTHHTSYSSTMRVHYAGNAPCRTSNDGVSGTPKTYSCIIVPAIGGSIGLPCHQQILCMVVSAQPPQVSPATVLALLKELTIPCGFRCNCHSCGMVVSFEATETTFPLAPEGMRVCRTCIATRVPQACGLTTEPWFHGRYETVSLVVTRCHLPG
jgi:hypothetical protein